MGCVVVGAVGVGVGFGTEGLGAGTGGGQEMNSTSDDFKLQ